MMRLQDTTRVAWRTDELGAILRHQLDARIDLDLKALAELLGEPLPPALAAANAPSLTYRQILGGANTPIELLRTAKEIFKLCRNHPLSPLPPEVAMVLYLACIAAAPRHHRRSITRMNPQSLRERMDWAMSRTWLEKPLHDLLARGSVSLKKQ